MRRPLPIGLAIVATLAATLTSTAAAPRSRPNAEYPAEFKARVRKSVERGISFAREHHVQELVPRDTPGTSADVKLAERLRFEDYGRDQAAALYWVLRRAGVPRDDPTARKARERFVGRSVHSLEQAFLVVMALTAAPLQGGDPFGAEDASAPVKIAEDDRAAVENMALSVLRLQRPGPPERPDDPSGGWAMEAADVTRFVNAETAGTSLALLILEAAARSGVVVPKKAFADAMDLLVRWQAPKGYGGELHRNAVRGSELLEWTEPAKARPFGYTSRLFDSPTGVDTAAGAVGLMICLDAIRDDASILAGPRDAARAAARDALLWLEQTFQVPKNPVRGRPISPLGSGIEPDAGANRRWLMFLSLAALHARMRFVGSHDWYQEGAESLMRSQRADGSWGTLWEENCFPLLFLLRASLATEYPFAPPPEK